MIDEKSKIGYVRMTSFSERTSADLEKILDQLEAEGMKGLILDLRFNPGGYPEQRGRSFGQVLRQAER